MAHSGWNIKEIDVRQSDRWGWCVTFCDECTIDHHWYQGAHKAVTPASMQRLVRLVQGWALRLDCENGIWTFVRPEVTA